MRITLALAVLAIIALPLPVAGQATIPPDTSELTLLGLGYRIDSTEVIRVLGRPDSIRSSEHPFDVGARIQTWYYQKVWVFFNAEGHRDGMKLVLPGLRTRRGLVSAIGRAELEDCTELPTMSLRTNCVGGLAGRQTRSSSSKSVTVV